MTKLRPYALSIAGYDPSGGAGVLADVKTFEQIGVYGFAVTTCITYQNDHTFEGVHWLSIKKIKKQLYPLLESYRIKYVKIGLMENFIVLNEIIELLMAYNPDIVIVWDPILRASAGFDFHKKFSRKRLQYIFERVTLITPNWKEIQALSGEKDEVKGAQNIAACCDVYLKGGHNIETPATDMLWIGKRLDILHPAGISDRNKHGTGCVLSSAITAYLALGKGMHTSCVMAKNYTYQFIESNPSNLGYHSS